MQAQDQSTTTGGIALNTPGRSTADSISRGSQSDYTCYTVRTTDDEIVAVLIETKTTKHPKFKQAVAQVIH